MATGVGTGAESFSKASCPGLLGAGSGLRTSTGIQGGFVLRSAPPHGDVAQLTPAP